MRIAPELKDEIIERLKQGDTPSMLSERYGVPKSTISDWNVKERLVHPTEFSDYSNRYSVRDILLIEAQITAVITPVIDMNVSDKKWEEIQVKVFKILQKFLVDERVKDTPETHTDTDSGTGTVFS